MKKICFLKLILYEVQAHRRGNGSASYDTHEHDLEI